MKSASLKVHGAVSLYQSRPNTSMPWGYKSPGPFVGSGTLVGVICKGNMGRVWTFRGFVLKLKLRFGIGIGIWNPIPITITDQPECVGRHTSVMILLTGRSSTILTYLLTYLLPLQRPPTRYSHTASKREYRAPHVHCLLPGMGQRRRQ